MTTHRELTATYIILGQSFIDTVPYDAKGAFVLINSMTESLGDDTPGFVDVASHLHMVAALSDNEVARREARRSMAHLIADFVKRRAPGVSA